MKPPSFRYERRETVRDAVELLAAEADSAKVLAGGQSLVALMNLRLAAPEVLLDIGPLDELRYIRRDGDMLRVGALTTQAELERDPALAQDAPLLAQCVPHVGHDAIRNRGTVGGSIAHADPAAELPIAFLALEGEVSVASAPGSRRIGAGDFFQGFLMTAIEPDELLTEVAFPLAREGAGYAFEEFARRPGDFALVSVACRVSYRDGGLASARVVLGGVGSAPVLVDGLEDLAGAGTDEAVAATAEAAAAATDVPADIHASPEYRRHLARELTRRAMARALNGRR